MKTAVVILNWNGQKLLEKFLPSVVRFSGHARVYVADNASTDDSVDFLKRNYPEVGIIQNEVNGGFARGYNDALAHLNEEVFVLLNSDVEVTENWLPPLIRILKENPKTGIVQPKILDYKNKEYFEYAGAAGGFIDKLGYPFCRGRIFDTLEKDEGQYNQETPVFWASGACLVIRRKLFEKLGGMDESYFAHQEEIDLCWRAHHHGYQVRFTPESKVYHLGGATLDSMNSQKTYLNFRNSLYNLLKNVPGGKVYGILFLRLCMDGIAGVKFIFEGRFKHTWAIIRAHFSFYKRFRQLYKKRPKKIINDEYASLKSIVISYYILRRRKFKALKLRAQR